MNRSGLYAGTTLGTGLIVGLMALAGAPTRAVVAAAFGFSYLTWNDLESRGGHDPPGR